MGCAKWKGVMDVYADSEGPDQSAQILIFAIRSLETKGCMYEQQRTEWDCVNAQDDLNLHSLQILATISLTRRKNRRRSLLKPQKKGNHHLLFGE